VSGDLANLQSQFSLAYVQAVASAAGFFVQEASRGFDMDGVDLTLMRRGALGVMQSPRLDLQVKSHQGAVFADSFPYDLDVTAYARLRVGSVYQVPRVLVVVLVPERVSDWLLHSEDQLVLRRCGYWLSLHGAAETRNTTKIRVQVPRTNQLDVAGLTDLMARVAAGSAP
jgi:hypothetical protein